MDFSFLFASTFPFDIWLDENEHNRREHFHYYSEDSDIFFYIFSLLVFFCNAIW